LTEYVLCILRHFMKSRLWMIIDNLTFFSEYDDWHWETRWFDYLINTFCFIISGVAFASDKKRNDGRTVKGNDDNLIAHCHFLSTQCERRVAAGEDTFTPASRTPWAVIVFIAKSKTEFHPCRLCHSIRTVVSASKGCEQRETKTSDGITLARKRNQRVSIFENLRNIYSCLVFLSVDAYFVLAFWILLVSSPPGYPILSVVCRLAAQLPAMAGKARIVEHASGKFFRRNDVYEKEQTSLPPLPREIKVTPYIHFARIEILKESR